jgi:tetratricopeptide (TPR) repeat protein
MTRTTLSAIAVALLLVGAMPAQAGWEEGAAAFTAGKFAQAAKEFEQVVQERPDWPGGYYMLGQAQLKLNRNQEALANLRKAYDLNPNDAAVQLVLANAYLELKRFEEANRLLSNINLSALSREQQAVANQMKAAAAAKSGNADQALAALAQAAKSSPNNASAQFNYGVASLKAGDTRNAVSALEKAARLDKDPAKQKVFIQASIKLARESGGSAKDQAYKKAADAAKALATANPSFDHLMLLGETQLGSDQYAAAAATFKQAAGKNPNDWLVHYYLGQAQTAAGQYGAAEAALKQALTKSNAGKDQVRTWKQLGFVYEKQRDFEQAKTAYRKAGDNASAQRVEENQEIAKYNKEVEAENEELQERQKEAEQIKKELEELPGGPPPPRR